MPAWPANCTVFARQLPFLLGIYAALRLGSCAQSFAQPIIVNLGVSNSSARFELAPPQVTLISGTTAARLEQLPALVAAANWDDALATLADVTAAEPGRVVAIDANRYIGLREYCHRQIARWPAAGLARYRQRVDAAAEQLYRTGLANRDEQLLQRILDDAFCSSWGDDALFALGELALERGDYQAARRYCEQISTIQRDPTDWLGYPYTNLDVAAVRARLILVSIRAGEWDRARLELDMFQRLHPKSAGRFGGQDGEFAIALQRLLAAAHDWPIARPSSEWPTFAGTCSRNGIAPALGLINGPAWREAIRISAVDRPTFQPQPRPVLEGMGRLSIDPAQPKQPELACFPVIADDRIYFCDESNIYAANIMDGTPAVTGTGEIYKGDPSPESGRSIRDFRIWESGVPRRTLTLLNGVLYGRIGAPATAKLQAGESTASDRLVGLALSRDGLLAFSARPEEGQWSFDGVPVGDERNLYVAMRRSDVNPQAAIACFDATTGRQLWRTLIGSANTLAGGRVDEVSHNLLTLVGDRIYFNSNIGLIASLQTTDGAIKWLHAYERGIGFAANERPPAHFGRDLSPAMHNRGVLYLAPVDTPNVFALDAETGRRLWSTGELPSGIHLLGVVDGTVVVAGSHISGIDAISGKIRYTWPVQSTAERLGLGRGVIAGHEAFFPTRKEIQVLDATTGRPTRSPISLSPVGGMGANLIAAKGQLIAAGPERIMAFGETLYPDTSRPGSSENETSH